jgi:hypothetical protein
MEQWMTARFFDCIGPAMAQGNNLDQKAPNS